MGRAAQVRCSARDGAGLRDGDENGAKRRAYGDIRASGVEVREWPVSSNDAERRLVYAILDHPKIQHYSAAAQVIVDGDGCRFVWTVDFLPDGMAGMQAASMEAGLAAMARALG